MRTKIAFLLSGLLFLVFLIACESPVSTEIKSGELGSTEYAVYSSSDHIYDPDWSPDGSKIAFCSRKRATDIYKIKPNGDTLAVLNRFYLNIYPYNSLVSPDEQYYLYRDNETYKFFLYSVTQDTNIQFNYNEYFNQLQWSYDSQHIFFMNGSNETRIIKTVSLDGEVNNSVTLDSVRSFNTFSVSPDNQSIVWSGRSNNNQFAHLWLYTPEGGQKTLLAVDSLDIISPKWSPDGQNIAFSVLDYRSHKYSLDIYSISAKTWRTLINDMPTIRELAWSQDSQTIYSLTYNESFYSYSLADNNSSFEYVRDIYNRLQINSDGTFYMASSSFYAFRLNSFSLSDKKLTLLFPETKDELLQPDWSPDGSSLVFSKNGKLCKVPASGGSVVSLGISSPSEQYNPDYSPDGSLIAFDNDNYIFMVPANGGTVKSYKSKYNDARNPVWSPDGDQIACIENDNDTRIAFYFYTDKELMWRNSWYDDGSITNISWSKSYSNMGSFILYSDPYLKVRGIKTGKEYVLTGYNGSLQKDPYYCEDACWGPEGDAVAWIRRLPDIYTLNTAQIIFDLQ